MALQIQKDTKYTKLFVGGLPYHTTNETLRDYFLQFGDIEEAVVIHCKATGKSKGYGFVTMMDKEAAEKAIEDPNPYIDGRRANVNLAYLGAKPKLGSPGSPLAPIHHNGFSPFPGPPHMSPPPTSNGVPFMSPIPPYFVEVPPFGPPNGPFLPPYGQMYPFFQPPFGFMPQNGPHQPMLNHPTVAN